MEYQPYKTYRNVNLSGSIINSKESEVQARVNG